MRGVMWGVLVGLSAWLPAAAQPFAFAEATIDNLQARMAAGALTARELTAAYLARIEELDKAGPKLNAIIELNPDALAIGLAWDCQEVPSLPLEPHDRRLDAIVTPTRLLGPFASEAAR